VGNLCARRNPARLTAIREVAMTAHAQQPPSSRAKAKQSEPRAQRLLGLLRLRLAMTNLEASRSGYFSMQ
jgi:hypothetical protein